MKHLNSIKRTLTTTLLITLLSVSNAYAALDPTTLTGDINNLILQGDELLVSIKGTSLTSVTMTSQLDTIETDVNNYQTSVTSLYDSVLVETRTNITLTDELLVAFQTLSTVTYSIAKANTGLSLQIAELASTTTLTTLDSSLTAMLRLSDDIGLMANRILEMANKILVMADNIGLMADRIIATQIIQSNNLQLVIDANLQTQTNTIEVIKLFL